MKFPQEFIRPVSPCVGDAVAKLGKRGLRYLDNNRILKRIGEWLGDNIIAPILERVGDITTPVIGQIKGAIRRKLAEAQEIARQLGEGVDNVTGRPQLATEGAGNVPNQVDNVNQPMQMAGSGGQLKPAIPSKVINDLKSFPGKTFKFGNETFQLDKKGLKHVLERHHPKYWNGTVKTNQSFLDPKLIINDVVNIISDVMKQNRDRIIERGTNRNYQIRGNYRGVEYVSWI